MKYLLKVLTILLIIFFSLKIIIHVVDKGHNVEYTIGNFDIQEELKVGKTDNYYFDIKADNFKLNFQIDKNYNKANKIINKLMYKEIDSYKCILPVFKNNQILTDIMCMNTNIITYYHDIKNSKIDAFAEELKSVGYNKEKFQDNGQAKELSNMQTIYENNLVTNHYLAFENYKGVTLVNGKINNIKLFDNDIYTKQVSAFFDKYYIVADYNQEYTFKKFYIVNLINGNIKEIRTYDEISFDSIIEGIVGNDIYIFDKDAEVQYKLSLKYETVEKTSEIKYYDGNWHSMSVSEALSGKIFDNYYSNDINGYDKVNEYGNYYYLYKKSGNDYLVYRADKQNPEVLTYLFTTTDMNSVLYLKDYIYYKNGNTLYYYFDNGIRKVIQYTELEFNNDILFGAYIK